ncbi:SDR family oxidoreductase [Dyadobacter sp. CY323]|uniref:SDR family oxidoreductase n=1 Tax=Dyadobacter sp. CY323 TaxID=2907302 RepID=UPI001F2F3569|nr:SDR family oxidoreductase [Dyadobacter sp. CY323]MCE6991835.1 SDR family oxidoreductase [Dyadobacter sp. CY323]
MELRLNGKVALVTGASTGYGVGIAEALVRAGAKVYITARSGEKLKAVGAQIGAVPIVADVTKKEDWDRVFAQIKDAENRLDILVNNAGGGGEILEIADQRDEIVEEVIALNLTGAIFGCMRAAAIMRAQSSGTIINISSICSVQAWGGWGVYGAAKAGLDQLTKHLYVEMRPFGVRVTSLVPSWGATDFNTAAKLDAFSEDIASKSIQPIEIGNIVVDVCTLPAHLVIPELRLLPLVQEIQAY